MTGKFQRVEHCCMLLDQRTRMFHQGKLVFEKTDVEFRVVNHEFAVTQKIDQFIGNIGEPRLTFEIRVADAVYALGAFVDGAFGIQKAVILATGQATIHEFEAAYLDDAVPLARGKPGCLKQSVAYLYFESWLVALAHRCQYKCRSDFSR
jgi:hypothetical protein